MIIRYHFELEQRKKVGFQVDLGKRGKEDRSIKGHASWTLLKHERCTICPLDLNRNEYCPPAVDLENVLGEFAEISSCSEVNATVVTPDRTFQKKCDAQVALNSLVGLIMAGSACPILSRLRSQTQFHLPFASIPETLYRTVGDYLIKQYLIKMDGGSPDFELKGLESLYRDLAELNRCFLLRIGDIAKRDAALNVLANLSCLSTVVQMSITDRLKEFSSLILG